MYMILTPVSVSPLITCPIGWGPHPGNGAESDGVDVDGPLWRVRASTEAGKMRPYAATTTTSGCSAASSRQKRSSRRATGLQHGQTFHGGPEALPVGPAHCALCPGAGQADKLPLPPGQALLQLRASKAGIGKVRRTHEDDTAMAAKADEIPVAPVFGALPV